ncbi:thioredoxin reductase (NADPH) [Lewinella marina]|uniref:Fused response regulator/thioredoxin-disulfide reductase n=1 Tax=Neolewinella marina TaxID=438751 RepID=A0A2G0CDJ7_9BACT|nr:FAD-dependent oxidoreductase [Neolewinella marina]NJB85976.1 thioredoxin reductase (NADPH) [Neolewinella marina]PHK98056.1 fused response regulator/thioredoxin-disulfide reductase [Neolewinella marina]
MARDRKPIILSVDDDQQVLRSLKRDLRSQYQDDYRIISTTQVEEALQAVEDLKKKGETIALFLSDQRMPDMLGVDFLEKAKPHYPNAKRVLLTAYSDTDAAIKAINEVQLDYYLLKPWDPPEEKLYPILTELLEDWKLTHRPAFEGIRVVGYQYSPKSHNVKDWLAANLLPYEWIDARSPQGEELVELHRCKVTELPLVILEDGTAFSDPGLDEVAEALGMSATVQEDLYDVVIIGGGPSGMAAAVYGGSEGLKTLVIEKRAPGGQAGSSSRIENYLGFPSGLSGSELTRRAMAQTLRFGVEVVSPREVTGIEIRDNYKILTLDDDSRVRTKSVILTTGVQYRMLEAEGADKFNGAGVYYGAATTEARACENHNVFVVGGGNSAGQGAVYLSKFAERVTILVRKPDLTASMSSYLIEQIESIDNITVQGYREVVKVCGDDDRVQRLVLQNLEDDSTEEVKADALFIFIGARPRTEWLERGQIMTDQRGFVITGRDLLATPERSKSWPLERNPYLLETCQPGIFAAGDVRSGAMNRVASAVGEGAMAIKFVHEYLGGF